MTLPRRQFLWTVFLCIHSTLYAYTVYTYDMYMSYIYTHTFQYLYTQGFVFLKALVHPCVMVLTFSVHQRKERKCAYFSRYVQTYTRNPSVSMAIWGECMSMGQSLTISIESRVVKFDTNKAHRYWTWLSQVYIYTQAIPANSALLKQDTSRQMWPFLRHLSWIFRVLKSRAFPTLSWCKETYELFM